MLLFVASVAIVFVLAALTFEFGPLSSTGRRASPTSWTREELIVDSAALGRSLPTTVFLPPGYPSRSERYPVLYVLHGLGGNRGEWEGYGIFEIAAAMMSSGEVPPFIIVLPEGKDGYWFNHANGGPRWGDYLVQDVVGAVDRSYRTIADRQFRAIGGLSMGADGALQLAMNNPDVFGEVQAHGPVLRPYELALSDYGNREYFEANYPVTLFQRKPEVARSLRIELDVGDADLWLGAVLAFHDELIALDVPHEWHFWSGGHDWDYWQAHIPDNLRTFGRNILAVRSQPH